MNLWHVFKLHRITGNIIGGRTASLSEPLKSNTTLTELSLYGEDKRKKTHKIHPSTIHYLFLSLLTENYIGSTGATSLSESLKSNTTLIQLDLSGEDKRKKTHKRHPSTFFLFYLSSQQQTTVLETQEQQY